MSDITMEKKLELVQQVRSQYHKNQYDMSNREQILYGRCTARDVYEQDSPIAEDTGEYRAFSLKLRLVLALVLLGAVIFLDRNNTKIAGIAMDEVFQAISADYYKEVEAFVDTMTQEAVPPAA